MSLKSTISLSHSQDLDLLNKGEHWDPHRFLGFHRIKNENVIRLWRPGALEVHLEIKGIIEEAQKVSEGLFEYRTTEEITARDYRVYHINGELWNDPYAFLPTWGELDSYFFGMGLHYQLYNVLGAHEIVHQGVKGVKFSVWAPSAKRVSLVSDFNYWDGRVNPMRSMGQVGIWELFIPGLKEGARYKFEIKTQNDELKIKADPLAFCSELRPLTASVVFNTDHFIWEDQRWIESRAHDRQNPQPMVIYELHAGSWKWKEGHPLKYRELAHELVHYCKEMHFTHVELLPVAEHPLDESWGYQVSGFYSITSRYGSPSDFQYFVNFLHKHEIGVLVDWVPAHFPTDDFSLGRFDGSSLYEHEDWRQGFHPHWNTYIFNYGRREVSNFLIANALFWFEKMHIDGLRVDAVASMLYLDYGRSEGEWIPNQYGGNHSLEAIEFLKHLNSIVHEKHPGIMMIAEESTAFTGVTRPVLEGGLGFDYKWNMGWMNDTLAYMSKDSFFRKYHQNELTFGLLYAFSERYILVLSHDEVVHGKKNLLSKMPGDYWQKFANLRLLYSYMICQPGKKLLFMGGEIGQWDEWYCKQQIHWHLLQYDHHKGLRLFIKEVNEFYVNYPALWENDDHYSCFEWVDFSDVDNSVLSYKRKGRPGHLDSELLCVHNFTPNFYPNYFVRLGAFLGAREILNSDQLEYGGSGQVKRPIEFVRNSNGEVIGLNICLAPLATIIFEIQNTK